MLLSVHLPEIRRAHKEGRQSLPGWSLCRSRESHIHNPLSTDSANHVVLILVRAVIAIGALLCGVIWLLDAILRGGGIAGMSLSRVIILCGDVVIVARRVGIPLERR